MGHGYDFGLGAEMDAAAVTACLSDLVARGCTARVRAIVRALGAPAEIVEVARTASGVQARTLTQAEAASIVAACDGHDRTIAYDTALLLDDGLMDLEVPGYDGEAFSMPARIVGHRPFEVGSVPRLARELREAIAETKAQIEEDPECEEEHARSVEDLEAMAAALTLCERFDLILRTWE